MSIDSNRRLAESGQHSPCLHVWLAGHAMRIREGVRGLLGVTAPRAKPAVRQDGSGARRKKSKHGKQARAAVTRISCGE